MSLRSRTALRPRAARSILTRPFLAIAASGGVLFGACAEWTAEPPRADVEGCYRLDIEDAEHARAPDPPTGLQLTDLPFLPRNASDHELSRHRFDAREAREAFLVYPDTAFRVAWWWEEAPERRFGVGNHNSFAAFYVDAIVRGDRLEGTMNRWRYDELGRPSMTGDAYTLPLSGRRTACRAR